MRNIKLTIAIAGAVVAGGAVVALLLGAGAAFAASPTASTAPAATAAASTAPSSGTNQPMPGGPVGHTESVSDESVIADAIGISVSDLQSALSGGQTVAQVAKAHNVDPQKVI